MRHAERVLVDTGAWIALALTRDPLHDRGRQCWTDLLSGGARLYTTIPIVMETFTFLDRNATRDVALAWKDSLRSVRRLRTLECRPSDLARAWEYFKRRDLYTLSAVDATSFVLMEREGIRSAFAFDHHFATAGFTLAG